MGTRFRQTEYRFIVKVVTPEDAAQPAIKLADVRKAIDDLIRTGAPATQFITADHEMLTVPLAALPECARG